MSFFRVHTSDIAFATKLPRGLFVAIGKLAESGILSEPEVATYWQNRHWFEEALPVPPFYGSGNPDRAITWFRDSPSGRDMFKRMTFYRDMAEKYGLELFLTTVEDFPGKVIYEDEFQIAVVGSSHSGPGFITKKIEKGASDWA